ncbi:MAG TPA: Do family serine endopeptidase [Terriglobia bacterium]|nr:Do family serine endopeptidase [Terriglobia bacterium]
MRRINKQFLRENFLGLSLTCIGLLLVALSLTVHVSHRADPFVLASGNGLDGADVQSLEQMNQAYERIAQSVLPTVVAITTTQVRKVPQSPIMMDPFFRRFFGGMMPNGPQKQTEHALGSGTIVSPDGYILTNNHVIADATTIQVVLHDNRTFTGKVVGADPDTDIAVVKIDAKDLPTATLGNSSTLKVGDTVMAFGNPFQQYFTVTKGIVSALGRADFGGPGRGPEPLSENFIQTDAAINPGNSGGALVNVRGQVIGVPTFILSGSTGPGGEGSSIGIGFAIPINAAKHVMTDLIKTGKVSRGYLGISVGLVSAGLAQEFHVPDTAGAFVQDVASGSPAAKAGVKDGDVVRTLNGENIAGPGQLTADVINLNPGETVTLGILRNGKHMDIKVVLGERPTNISANGNPNTTTQAPTQGTLAGVAVQNLTPDIRQQLGLPSQISGVVVTGVDSNSPAAQYLTQGDVIMGINRQPVHNVTEFNHLASEAKGQTLLRVARQGEAMFIVITPGGDGQ